MNNGHTESLCTKAYAMIYVQNRPHILHWLLNAYWKSMEKMRRLSTKCYQFTTKQKQELNR